MAEVNGVPKQEDTVSVSHLGKRKRTASPEVERSKDSGVQPALQDVLRLLRKYDTFRPSAGSATNSKRRHDTSPSLLKYPLPAVRLNEPDLKRARLVKPESSPDTIEDRILTGTYHSLHTLKEDARHVHDAILLDSSASVPNGTEGRLSKMLDVLEHYTLEPLESSKTNADISAKTALVIQKPKQFLSLRSSVNGGAHVLFSGLEVQQQSKDSEAHSPPEEAIGTSLPNGFELTDFSTLGGKEMDLKKPQKRTFKVFTQHHHRVKTLDLPHTAKNLVRGNTLDFVPNSSRAENLPLNKHDYKFAKLSTGSWLSYRRSQQDRRKTRSSSNGTDFKAALAANNVRQSKEMTEDELFTSVYSSFAPSSDNAYSLIAEEDLDRQWWSQHGEKQLSRIVRPVDNNPPLVDGEAKGTDEFADLAANFVAEEEEGVIPEDADKEVDSLLEEVSEMIKTLSSHQRNRSLIYVANGTSVKLEKPEFDLYETLRDQLSILIATLPPFAVAKLNGDQLDELNISTRIVGEVPDYPGTGQPNDLVRRQPNIVQQAAPVVNRPTITPQPVRPYSSVQPNTASYNSQHRNYNAGSIPATSGYGVRTAQGYQTPSMPRQTYSQTPTFQASTNTATHSASRATIQQFNGRAIQNTYSNYGNNTPLAPQQQSQTATPTTGAGFAQRPSQPGYQQRAQDTAAVLARSTSPQKPQAMVNGAAQHYTPRQYQAPTQQNQSQGQTAPMHAYPRQGSGTPTTPIAQPTLAARYDSAAGGTPARAGQITAPQAQQQGQTVEVSR